MIEPASQPIQAPQGRREDPRVARSRAAILAAASALFLRDGYTATTMDAIAAEAGVSKRTVYNNFADKPMLFREVVLAATGSAAEFAATIDTLLADPADLNGALNELARRLTATTLDSRLLALRRLLIGEAHRFPDLAAEYYERAPGKVIATLTRAFERLHGAGLLHAPDSRRAAEAFAFLTLGPALDRAMFEREVNSRAAARSAEQGVRTFLTAFGVAG